MHTQISRESKENFEMWYLNTNELIMKNQKTNKERIQLERVGKNNKVCSNPQQTAAFGIIRYIIWNNKVQHVKTLKYKIKQERNKKLYNFTKDIWEKMI